MNLSRKEKGIGFSFLLKLYKTMPTRQSLFVAVLGEEQGMVRATSTLSRVSTEGAGLGLGCPAEDAPGMRYPRTRGAVALLPQLLRGTAATSSVSWRPVPRFCDGMT